MSSLVRFTPFQPVDGDETVYTSRNSHGAGVRITDRDGLHEELSETLVSQMDTRTYVETDEYPGKQWELLLGFTTFGGDSSEPGGEAEYHNVSNTGPKDLAGLWARVSEFTEPFVVYMTTFEGAWPHAAALDAYPETVYKAVAEDGDVTLTELTVGVLDEEEVSW